MTEMLILAGVALALIALGVYAGYRGVQACLREPDPEPEPKSTLLADAVAKQAREISDQIIDAIDAFDAFAEGIRRTLERRRDRDDR